MKKYLLILGMITCILGLTACGSEDKAEEGFITEMDAYSQADQIINSVMEAYNQGPEAVEYYSQQDERTAAIFDSWENALDELGDYNETLDHHIKFDGDEAIITVDINGTNMNPKGVPREAEVELIIDKKEGMKSFVVNVEHTTGENMKNAGLNTLLGMGTVFAILILIALIISLFNFIPKIQKAFSKKGDVSETKEKAVDNTIAQIIENEELSDDTELVAVIAAAIAASEGAASTDGFVVRSIRRAKTNKWQRA
jgi:sodium pump decarboxylase gamma subunit